jgi:thiol oxidase
MRFNYGFVIIGCNGSEPHHRGYPCGLWTLFHTITVNAAKDDNMNLFNGLSSTIVDYVQNFFQCRHCAKNFQMKVRSIKQGALPEKAKDTMMWLWQIHNMANIKLTGIDNVICNENCRIVL